MLADWAGAERFISFSIGAKIDYKSWGEDNWRRALGAISRNHPELGLVMVGAASDLVASQQAAEVWQGPVLDLCGLTPPRISALVIECAALYMGHDSGPMHLAASVGTPAVVLGQTYTYSLEGPGRPGNNDDMIFVRQNQNDNPYADGVAYNMAEQVQPTSDLYALNVRVLVPEEHVENARALLDAEGLSLGGEGPAYIEADERIAEGETEHETLTGMRPLVYFVLILLGLALMSALKMLRE